MLYSPRLRVKSEELLQIESYLLISTEAGASLLDIYIVSTEYLHNIYIISTQYLHQAGPGCWARAS